MTDKHLMPSRPLSKTRGLSAIYPGSFDPITNGHIDLIKRLSALFDSLVVLTASFSEKKYLFSLKERLHIARACLKNIPKVKVDSCEGLTVDYMRRQNIQVIIRGVRAVSDFEYELTMAAANKQLFKKCETFIAFARPEYTHLSSQVVKDIARHGGDLSQWLPQPVQTALHKKFKTSPSNKKPKTPG